MASLIVVVFSLGASFTTIAESSYSNCPKVSLAVPSSSMPRSLAQTSRPCSGTLLRASKIVNTSVPGVPDAGGQKDYSTKSGSFCDCLFLYEHILNGLQRFVSIRWARNPTYALSEENGKLRFKVTTNSNRPPDEFLFSRLFLRKHHQAFRMKSSRRYLVYSHKNCSVSLSESAYKPKKQNGIHRFRVTCKPFLPEHNCFCFPM